MLTVDDCEGIIGTSKLLTP